MSDTQDTLEAETRTAVGGAELVATLSRLHGMAALLLSQDHSVDHWPDRIRALAQRLEEIQSRASDAVLYLLYFTAARTVKRYSSHHALVSAATVRECALQLGWPAAEIHCLMRAALTMNLSVTELQDELVYRERTLTMEQRKTLDHHPARSVAMLTALGVDDPLWLDVVMRHHDDNPTPATSDLEEPGPRLADLLHRVDVFTAKMSPRKTRKGLPPTLAVRDAYLGNGGTPDRIGMAVTQAIGIYPPGSLVKLINGDTAIVVRRGPRISQPAVVSLVSAERRPYEAPVLRAASDSTCQVTGLARLEDVRFPVSHEQMLSLAASAG